MLTSKLNVEACCRCCLQMHGPFTPLFGLNLNSMFSDLTSLPVDTKDGYPQQICSRCITKISMACTFKKMAVNNYYTLKKLINNEDSVQELPNQDLGSCNAENQKKDESFVNSQQVALNREQAEQVINKNCTVITDVPKNKVIEEEDLPLNYSSFKCPYCIKEFLHKPDLNDHLKSHTTQCKVCHKTVASNMITRHLRAHNKRKYTCSVCGKVISDSTNYYMHLKKHKEVNEVKNELCPFCGKKFKWRTSLYKHISMHTNGPHYCKICGKQYAHYSYFKDHLLQHVTEERYSCDICSTTYKVKGSLIKHKFRAHKSNR